MKTAEQKRVDEFYKGYFIDKNDTMKTREQILAEHGIEIANTAYDKMLITAMKEAQEQAAVLFADWIDKSLMTGILNRLTGNDIKWFYNHKPLKKEGNQDWRSYTTNGLYNIFSSKKEV